MSDYQRIARAISFIVDYVDRQPSLEEIAKHVGLSPYHFQRMFCRWAGVTPKRYLQILTLQRAKRLLRESRSILEVSDTVGLSSGSRLHDHFVRLDAVTPGEYKAHGDGLTIEHAVHETPFGDAFVASTPRGLCTLGFLEHGSVTDHLDRLRKIWGNAEFREDKTNTSRIIETVFTRKTRPDRPLSLVVSGTNFQVSVWRALLRIPQGMVTSYSEIAAAVGRPKAARAIGQAVGANPVAFLIPCHRVIQTSGRLGGYRWGETRKHAIHAWEAAAI